MKFGKSVLTPNDEKGRWIRKGLHNKLEAKFFICELIDNSIQHSDENKKLEIIINWDSEELTILDNGYGIDNWVDSLKRYSKDLKKTKSEFNVGMKDAIQYFGMQCSIYSRTSKSQDAVYINAHYCNEDNRCTWPDETADISWQKILDWNSKFIPYKTGTLIKIEDLYKIRKDKTKINEVLSPEKFKKFCVFLGIRYWKDFMNRQISININAFGHSGVIDRQFIINKKIPREFWKPSSENIKKFLTIKGIEHSWDEMIQKGFDIINEQKGIHQDMDKFTSFDALLNSPSSEYAFDKNGNLIKIEFFLNKFTKESFLKQGEFRWEFIWKTNLNGTLETKMDFQVIFGIPERINANSKKIETTNNLLKKELGIRIYQHNRGIHIMEKSLRKKDWIKDFTNETGTGVFKTEGFDLEIHLPIHDKLRTETNKLQFSNKLIEDIKNSFAEEIYIKLKLYYVILIANFIKNNAQIINKHNKSKYDRQNGINNLEEKIKQIRSKPKLEKNNDEWIIGVDNKNEGEVYIVKSTLEHEASAFVEKDKFKNYNSLLTKENSGQFDEEKRKEFNVKFEGFVGEKEVILYTFNAWKNLTTENLSNTPQDRNKKHNNSLIFGFILVCVLENIEVENKEEWLDWLNEKVR